MSIRVIINGAHGKMGQISEVAVQRHPNLTLVASTGRNDDLAQVITEHTADVVIDFTLPDCVFENTQTIIRAGARPVIGTSGLTRVNIDQLTQLCLDQKMGGIIAPNFSMGAILMMRYAKDAAQYFPDMEIIEMHHEQKVDAPSGTAVKTAELMADSRHSLSKIPHTGAARGEKYEGIPIHSVRLPGFFAHQMVVFGGIGETLTIRHDSTDRESMMPGVCLACHKVMTLQELIYGLENVL